MSEQTVFPRFPSVLTCPHGHPGSEVLPYSEDFGQWFWCNQCFDAGEIAVYEEEEIMARLKK